MQEITELIQAAHEGSKTARDKLIEDNVGLVWSIVRRFSNRGYEMEDLFQIGVIGLMKAVDKFDLSFQVCFSTYAVPMIMGEIKRFMRDDGMIKVSRTLKEYAIKAKEAGRLFRIETNREPTIEELAQRVGISREELAVALCAGTEVESLHKTIYQSDGNEIELMDRLEDKEHFGENLLDKLVVEQLMQQLSEEERELIRLRYYAQMTQTNIAKQMGISQVQVSRMEKKILTAMREQLRS